MDDFLKESMFQYYDERAQEYDEIYLYGKGSTAYIEETNNLKIVVNDICFGNILDIPSGTAFWLPSYADKCDSLLLIDQSRTMLEISKKRAQQNGIGDRYEILQADLFDFDFPFNKFDIILTGFFNSHLTEQEEYIFLSRIKDSLNSRGKILVLDSAWSQKRAENREKEGKQVRRLNNGTEFTINKKYFETSDIEEIGSAKKVEDCYIAYFH